MQCDDSDLCALPSFRFYYKLDNGGNKDDTDIFWIGFELSLKTYTDILSIFDKLIKGIYYASYISKSNSYYNVRWNYLYFWVGEKISHIVSDNDKFLGIIYILNTVRSHFFEKETYDLFNDNMTLEHFNDLKKIYDFFQNYDNIDGSIKFSKSCTEPYKKYIEDSFSVYKRVNAECKVKKEEKHCKIYNDFVDTYDKKNLSELICDGKKVSMPVAEEEPNSFTEEQRYPVAESDVHPGTGIPEHSTPMHTKELSTPSYSDNAMSIIFPPLGIISTLFILYRFTPVGSWLNSRLLKKEIIPQEEHENKSEELLENLYEPETYNAQNRRNSIGYHPF
ncbi:PIR Superfamily Protein [Plasmodium ovale wallikeri]|uniref:PIR Superfamily Protein n=1 Tax=Plasmodium ovale wallikeri TaxID=864142 RepID=A0A1A9ANZ7_PLAOA|nr:PIR Superfamily Protein [Plasmodium ovale wallikeri]SBT57921.1 PIR Superfamily Protein [Plasmodium ovale wallikeri]